MCVLWHYAFPPTTLFQNSGDTTRPAMGSKFRWKSSASIFSVANYHKSLMVLEIFIPTISHYLKRQWKTMKYNEKSSTLITIRAVMGNKIHFRFFLHRRSLMVDAVVLSLIPHSCKEFPDCHHAFSSTVLLIDVLFFYPFHWDFESSFNQLWDEFILLSSHGFWWFYFLIMNH